MPDDIDAAQEREEELRREALAKHTGFQLEAGTQGDCDLCSRWSGRLIQGACAPCRERYKLP